MKKNSVELKEKGYELIGENVVVLISFLVILLLFESFVLSWGVFYLGLLLLLLLVFRLEFLGILRNFEIEYIVLNLYVVKVWENKK